MVRQVSGSLGPLPPEATLGGGEGQLWVVSRPSPGPVSGPDLRPIARWSAKTPKSMRNTEVGGARCPCSCGAKRRCASFPRAGRFRSTRHENGCRTRSMGSASPDRVPFAVHAHRANTVGDMIARHWSVYSRCEVCQVELDTPLRALPANLVLWDRHPRCRRRGCRGRVTFHGRPGGGSIYRPLTGAERNRADGL